MKRTNMLLEDLSETVDLNIIGLPSNKWLLFTSENEHGVTLDFAYNLETNKSTMFLNGTVDSMDELRSLQQASDCPRTLFAIRHLLGTIVVFDLDGDGHLKERLSFPVQQQVDRRTKIVAAFKTHVFVRSGSFVKVYNPETGECGLRSFKAEDSTVAVSKSRQEIYIVDDSIKAFCLEEPAIV